VENNYQQDREAAQAFDIGPESRGFRPGDVRPRFDLLLLAAESAPSSHAAN